MVIFAGMNMELRQALREIILDRQQMELEGSTPRDLVIEPYEKKVSICMGVRRCGKSTLMEGIVAGLRKKRVARENIVWLNFMDDRLAALEEGDWNDLYEAYYSLYPEKRRKEKVYFIFDEMQDYPGWQLFIERLRRDEKSEIYLTGSSSKLLSKEIATCLRGRTMTWELYPFSFGEYLSRAKVSRKVGRLSTTQRMEVLRAWENYKQTGGFPEVYGLSAERRRQLHQEYFSSILYHDVVERNAVGQPLVLRSLARRMLNQVGTLLSISKVCKDFSSMGYSVSRETISQYVQWLEDAFFLITVPACSASMGEQQRRMHKVYCTDHAMAASLGARITANTGQMLENIVCVELRRHTHDLYYYTTQNKYEVDFLATLPGGGRHLVQVCHAMDDATTRRRELRALTTAMQETGIKNAWVVTEGHEEDIPTPHGTIHALPAWKWLLTFGG